MDAAVAAILDATGTGRGGYVCVTGVHGVMEAQDDPDLLRIHNDSLLTVPDGMPLVWIARRRGIAGVGRVYGPDLMQRVMERGAGERKAEDGKWTKEDAQGHFLLGSTTDTLQRLEMGLSREIPGVRLAGSRPLPFGSLTEEDWRGAIDHVKGSGAAIVWVGLSTPKQERFMAEFLRRWSGPKSNPCSVVLIGVGAAFDLHAGLRRDTPGWMKRAGLQWLHRAVQEPRRLGPRYIRIVPGFLVRILFRSCLKPAKPNGG